MTAQGGDGNYVYAVVSNGSSTPAFSDYGTSTTADLQSGSYTVYVRDNNGTGSYCQASVDLSLPEIELPTATINVVEPSCFGDNGLLSVSVSSGSPSYSISVTDSSTVEVASSTGVTTNTEVYSLASGATYTISIVDANGCSVTTEQYLGAPEALVAGSPTTTIDVVCNSDGTNIPSQGGSIVFSSPSGGSCLLYTSDAADD